MCGDVLRCFDEAPTSDTVVPRRHRVVFGAADGSVWCVEAHEVCWVTRLKGPVFSSCCIVGSSAVCGCHDHCVCALLTHGQDALDPNACLHAGAGQHCVRTRRCVCMRALRSMAR